ncbi:MAG: site-specific DNA-methyltransferase [Candidatus Brocadia sp. WS118]|nr:MAG: site-specific DNA-methyltransferase [Candidatus Brocadia sp. WS118]
METNKTYNENCLETMRRMPHNFIDCVVTSPPYWGLRDYGHEDQIGLEPTPEEYVSKMVEIFREVRRVLRPEGTCWLNLGDSYNSDPNGMTNGKRGSTLEGGAQLFDPLRKIRRKVQVGNGLKPKDLVGIPWMVAFALRSDGWWLRQDIIWAKPNPMPESVKDRCTKAHEYIFLLTKSERYFYDAEAIKEPANYNTDERIARAKSNHKSMPNSERNGIRPRPFGGAGNGKQNKDRRDYFYYGDNEWRNKRSIWEITTQPFPAAHFATFPLELPSLCILAGSPKDGIIYDPFMGAATTALAALKYGRQFIGSEINPEYCEIGNKRIAPYLNQLTLAI